MPLASRNSFLLAIAVLLIAAASASTVQANGRWSWRAGVGLRDQRTISTFGSGQERETGQQNLRLAFGMDGYLTDPTIGSFSVDLGYLLTKFSNGVDYDRGLADFRTRVTLLPKGTATTQFHFARGDYNFENVVGNVDEDAIGYRLPDTVTDWGANVSVRRGAFRGLMAGFSHVDLDYSSGDENDVTDHQMISWSGGGRGGLQHSVKVFRRYREYGLTGLTIDNVNLMWIEQGPISPRWRWFFSGNGRRNESGRIDPLTAKDSRINDVVLRNQFDHRITERRNLILSYNLRRVAPEGSPTLQGHELFAQYRQNVGEGWVLTPFGQAARETSNGSELWAPRLGMGATWARQYRRLNTLLDGRVSYGRDRYESESSETEQSRLAYGINATLGHGQDRALRKELQLAMSHRELDLTRELLPDFPTTGVPLSYLDEQDSYRARVTLRHTWDSSGVDGWLQWHRRESSRSDQLDSFASDELMATFSMWAHRWNLNVNVGEVAVAQELLGEQQIRYVAGAVVWRPLRGLGVRSTYRRDFRDILLAPDVQGQRLEVGASYQLGRILLSAYLFKTDEMLDGAPDRTTEGFRWSISTRFDGWLPIQTGVQRRGVIR